MKKIFLAISILFTISAWSQKEGEVVYTTKVNLHAMIPDDSENAEMIKSMMPEFQETKSTLLFTDTETFYGNGGETIEKESESLDDEGNGLQVKISMEEPEEKIYTDVEKGLVVEQRELMDKTFLIKDTIDQTAWKITGEQKEVSGLSCMKATMTDEDGELIEAWFTPQIPVSSGPAGFGGLPGLIVYISMNDGNITLTATNIIPREIKKGEIVAPKKGKTVTREKFAKLEQKKMEQMQKQYSGQDGNVIMITNE